MAIVDLKSRHVFCIEQVRSIQAVSMIDYLLTKGLLGLDIQMRKTAVVASLIDGMLDRATVNDVWLDAGASL